MDVCDFYSEIAERNPPYRERLDYSYAHLSSSFDMDRNNENVRFEDVTDVPEKVHESLVNNYEEWGPPLSLEDYLSRESQLHEMHTKNGLVHRYYALIAENSEKVVASCEVLTRPLYHGGSVFTDDNCIASVFVIPERRGKGYGAILIQNVVDGFHNGGPENQLSLWSDVGDYYSKFGFMFPPSFQGEPQWNRSIIFEGSKKHKVDCEILDAEETMIHIIPEHQRLLQRHVDSLFNDCQGEIDVAVVHPHRGLYEQLQFRAKFTAKQLKLVEPTKFSARSPDGHGWVSWTYMFGQNKLLILGIFGSANEMSQLLAAAAAVAAEYDLSVELYDSSIVDPRGDIDELNAAVTSINLPLKVIEREKSLPMSIGDSIWISQGGYAWY